VNCRRERVGPPSTANPVESAPPLCLVHGSTEYARCPAYHPEERAWVWMSRGCTSYQACNNTNLDSQRTQFQLCWSPVSQTSGTLANRRISSTTFISVPQRMFDKLHQTNHRPTPCMERQTWHPRCISYYPAYGCRAGIDNKFVCFLYSCYSLVTNYCTPDAHLGNATILATGLFLTMMGSN